jgi:hypothetical protein
MLAWEFLLAGLVLAGLFGLVWPAARLAGWPYWLCWLGWLPRLAWPASRHYDLLMVWMRFCNFFYFLVLVRFWSFFHAPFTQ